MSTCIGSTSRRRPPHDRHDHPGSRPARRRSRHRQGRGHPSPRGHRRDGRPDHPGRPARRPTPWPARRPRRPGCPAASRSRTAGPRPSTCPPWPSPGSSPKVEFGAKDGPADLAFLIVAPAGGDATHLKVLTQLARALVKAEFTSGAARGRHARGGRRPGQRGGDPRARRRPPLPAPAAAAAPAAPAAPAARRSLVAVTACPTGIAHTYMAAEALERRGRAPASTSRWRPRARPAPPRSRRPPSPHAAAVIFAVDVGVRDRARFAGKPMVSSGVKRADRRRRRDDRRRAAVRRPTRRAAGRGHGGRRGRRRRRRRRVVGRPRSAGS